MKNYRYYVTLLSFREDDGSPYSALPAGHRIADVLSSRTVNDTLLLQVLVEHVSTPVEAFETEYR